MELTLAVITKNRPQKLKKCLTAIFGQKVKNFSILVVDNDPACTAEPVVDDFRRLNIIHIDYIGEPVPGYSSARNCALQHCKTQLIGFIDDDCVLDEGWVQQGLTAIQKYHSAFVVGLSNNTPSKSILSRVERFATTRWRMNAYDQVTF